MEICIYKNAIRKFTDYVYCVPPKPDHDTTNDNNKVPMRDSVIDDSRRANTTVCEM